MIRLERYTSNNDRDWDEFIRNAKNSLFLFFRNYMDYHKDRFTDHSLLYYKKDKIVAVLPANEEGKIIVTHGGLTFGGLLMSNELKCSEVLNLFEKTKKYYCALGFVSMTYKVIPNIFKSIPADEDLYALFMHNARLIRRDMSSAIFMKKRIRFSESKRQAVVKCKNSQVEVVETSNFTDYWSLLEQVLSKFDLTPVHSLEEISYLHHLFPQNIRLFEARLEDELIAGVVVYDYGEVAHTQYMANSSKGRQLGALDFINHKLIEEVFSERAYYSFGISTVSQGKVLNTGLIQQKETMGGRGIVHDFYSMSLVD